MKRTVKEFMTQNVQTIGSKQPLAAAHRLMNELGIRHLPVLEKRELVGIVSMRDLHLVETLEGVDPKEVTVEEAMSQDTFRVGPNASLTKVAREMAKHKYGSAVVMRGSEVVGIFTTIDALRALDEVLTEATRPARAAKKAAKTISKKTSPATRARKTVSKAVKKAVSRVKSRTMAKRSSR